MSNYLNQQKLKLLYGDELIKKQKECEETGFSDVCRNVLEKIMMDKYEEITRCEVKFLLKKLGK